MESNMSSNYNKYSAHKPIDASEQLKSGHRVPSVTGRVDRGQSFFLDRLNKNILNYDYAFITQESNSFLMTMFFSKQKFKQKAISYIDNFAKTKNIRHKIHASGVINKQKRHSRNPSCFNPTNNFILIEKPNQAIQVNLFNKTTSQKLISDPSNTKNKISPQNYKNTEQNQKIVKEMQQHSYSCFKVFIGKESQVLNVHNPIKGKCVQESQQKQGKIKQKKVKTNKIDNLNDKSCLKQKRKFMLEPMLAKREIFSPILTERLCQSRNIANQQKNRESVQPFESLPNRVKKILGNFKIMSAILQQEQLFPNPFCLAIVEDQTPSEFS